MRTRLEEYGDGVTVWLTAQETAAWAFHSPDGQRESTLAGRRVRVRFDTRGTVIETRIDGRVRSPDGIELTALLEHYGPRGHDPRACGCSYVTFGIWTCGHTDNSAPTPREPRRGEPEQDRPYPDTLARLDAIADAEQERPHPDDDIERY